MHLKPFPCDRQMDMMDCGPACLKMIAKFYGKYYSLQHLRDLSGTSREGVSLLGLGHAAEQIGLKSISAKCSLEDILYKIPLPAIIHWKNSHFVVVYHAEASRSWFSKKTDSLSKAKIYVSDPAKGLITYDAETFKQSWIKETGQKGVILVLQPQADFKQRFAGEKSEHKKTIQNFLSYFTPYKKSFLNLFVVMLLVTLMQALLPFISKAVIDVGIQTHDLDFINIVLFANIAIIVSIILSNAVRDWILQHLTSRVNIALISDYLIKLMKLPVTFFENKMMGDILQRAMIMNGSEVSS